MQSTLENKEEQMAENQLRPRNLKDFFGQISLMENLIVYIGAANKRKEALDHVLVYGPPGLGKTSLANVIANELGHRLICVSGPTIEKCGDMASILSSIEPGDVLFIDEIHRIPKVVEEFLFGAMEDFQMNVLIDHDKDSENLTIHLPPFTIVGATTRISALSWPLRQRFGIHFKFEFYKVEELVQIVQRSSQILGNKIDEKAAYEIAIRSRGTPRIANRLLRRVRDYLTYQNKKVISLELAQYALNRIGVDEIGLDQIDLAYLTNLISRFNGGPVGIETLASSFGEDPDTLEEVVEPFLISLGLINRTPRGREITSDGKAYFLSHHPERIKN